MNKQFKVGNTYWGIRTGWGFERITQVKLTGELKKDNVVIGFESKDVGPDGVAGSCGIQIQHVFHTEDEAKAHREKMVQDRINEVVTETNTPEKMLNYLLSHMYNCDSDGHVEWAAKRDLERRAREMFGLKKEGE
jgi:hypothetical protein